MRRGASDSEYSLVGNHLVRTVTLPDGRSYIHRCSKAVYEAVAYAVEGHSREGVTGEAMSTELDLPFTQVYVALSFLVERGCVVVQFRRNFPASDILFEDAMTEFHALEL